MTKIRFARAAGVLSAGVLAVVATTTATTATAQATTKAPRAIAQTQADPLRLCISNVRVPFYRDGDMKWIYTADPGFIWVDSRTGNATWAWGVASGHSQWGWFHSWHVNCAV